jgi:hypothetical protein
MEVRRRVQEVEKQKEKEKEEKEGKSDDDDEDEEGEGGKGKEGGKDVVSKDEKDGGKEAGGRVLRWVAVVGWAVLVVCLGMAWN